MQVYTKQLAVEPPGPTANRLILSMRTAGLARSEVRRHLQPTSVKPAKNLPHTVDRHKAFRRLQYRHQANELKR
jgi:hypothetical protein